MRTNRLKTARATPDARTRATDGASVRALVRALVQREGESPAVRARRVNLFIVGRLWKFGRLGYVGSIHPITSRFGGLVHGLVINGISGSLGSSVQA